MAKSQQLAGATAIVLIAVAGGWLALRRSPDAALSPGVDLPDVAIAQPTNVADGATPIPSKSALPEVEPPWVPSGKACRHPTTHGATFAQVSDAILAAAIIEGYDPRTHRVPMLNAGHPSDGGDVVVGPNYGTYFTRDCRGDRIEYETPLSDADTDTSTGTARLQIHRHDIRDSRMAVYVVVAIEPGYYSTCRGFQAMVRLDEDELVVEGVGHAEVSDCDNAAAALHLAPLGDKTAMLLPVNVGTGESGDAESEWQAYVPDHGALRRVGQALQFRGAGNGTISTGRWFGNVSSTLLDAGTLEIAETWSFERYDVGGKTVSGPKRKVIRTYTLREGGLVRSPKADPTLDADPAVDP